MLEVVPMVFDGVFVVVGRAGYPGLHAIKTVVRLSKVCGSIITIFNIIRSIAARVARNGGPPEQVTAPAKLRAGGPPFV
jgi:hypothetical protein